MAKRIGIGILTIFVILVVYFIVRQAPEIADIRL